jgi:hypothetical protein
MIFLSIIIANRVILEPSVRIVTTREIIGTEDLQDKANMIVLSARVLKKI